MINGIINIYKERGYTSHDVVAKMRGILRQRKIGHTGTLDPDAEGVLPVCLGSATKLCDMMTDKSKEYQAVLLLGVSTDTQDITGKIMEERSVECDEEKIRAVISSFIGQYMQIPPMYSALKVNGQKLVDLARAGITYKEVHLEACKVLAENMKKLGLMKGEVEDIVSSGAHALFMPHGLGHMMGMTVHDMENFGEINVGYEEGEEKSTQFGLASLRLAKKLEIGNVFTIEPGIYFIPELFEKWKNEKLHQEFLNYDEIEKYMDFGGIRMERDILIQEDGTSRILGDKFPRTADEIEEYMENKNR